jgi:hypothetical protein
LHQPAAEEVEVESKVSVVKEQAVVLYEAEANTALGGTDLGRSRWAGG